MAKQDLFDEAQEKGLVAEDAEAGNFTVAELEDLLGGAEGREYVPDEGNSPAEVIEEHDDLEAGAVGLSVVQSTTEATPREGDETPMPNKLETEPAAPVSTQEPDEPIAQTLAAGAGEHTPPDPEKFDKEGRPRSVSEA